MMDASVAGKFDAIKDANAAYAAKQKAVAELYARWEWLEAKARGED